MKALYNLVRFGPRHSLTSKCRDVRPSVLEDPSLGTHHHAKLKDVCLHYVDNGPAKAPLLLFLHGFPEFWYSWRHQLRDLSQDFRTIAIDMRGYGESDKPLDVADYHMNNLLADLKQFIEYTGYESCYLIGHDWGGAVAWTFAAKHPELVEKLICCNIPNPFAMQTYLRRHPSQMLKSWYMFMFQLPWLPEWFLGNRDMYYLGVAFRRVMTEKPELFTKNDLEAYKYTFRTFDDRRGPINYYRAAFRYKSPQLPSYTVQAPTMVVWGTKDRYLEKEMIEPSRKYVNNVCIVRYIESASHWVQQQEPELVNNYIREFIADNY